MIRFTTKYGKTIAISPEKYFSMSDDELDRLEEMAGPCMNSDTVDDDFTDLNIEFIDYTEPDDI